MKKFDWVEHPGDIGFRAYGADLAETFENAALALRATLEGKGQRASLVVVYVKPHRGKPRG